MQKKYKKQKNKNQVNEPNARYEASSITFFNSLEELEEDNYRWLASLTPEQHLQHATALIKRVFANNLKQRPTLGNKIFFD